MGGASTADLALARGVEPEAEGPPSPPQLLLLLRPLDGIGRLQFPQRLLVLEKVGRHSGNPIPYSPCLVCWAFPERSSLRGEGGVLAVMRAQTIWQNDIPER